MRLQIFKIRVGKSLANDWRRQFCVFKETEYKIHQPFFVSMFWLVSAEGYKRN